MRFFYIAMCVLTFLKLEAFHFHGEQLMLERAQSAQLPIVALFLTDEGCWSEQLKEKVLHSPQFTRALESHALIWPVCLEKDSEDKALEKAYGIEQCPVILLLDPKGKEFARIAYEGADGSDIAARAWRLISDFQQVCQGIDRGLQTLSQEELERLYLQTQHLSPPYFRQLVLAEGVQRKPTSFFLLEKYADLLKQHALKDPLVLKYKRQLLQADPHNQKEVQRKVALLEFEKRSSCLKKRDRAEKALLPLFKYLKQFGARDTQRWQVELIIAHYYFSKKAFHKALTYATAASSHAPEAQKEHIARTLACIKEAQ